MKIFDLFTSSKRATIADGSTIPDSEKRYYQDDSYYTDKAFEGTQFEREVVTFEKRKTCSIPSKRGLYVGEILLLEYVSYGKYPGPKNGYPGFWWFKYGIRDVGAMLRSLEERGFIEYSDIKDSLSGLTVAELKELLNKYNVNSSEKKVELINKVKENLSDEQIIQVCPIRKYKLTETGFCELSDNKYVPYMHKEPLGTNEDSTFGPVFNVWSINRLLNGNTEDWESVVAREKEKLEKYYNR